MFLSLLGVLVKAWQWLRRDLFLLCPGHLKLETRFDVEYRLYELEVRSYES